MARLVSKGSYVMNTTWQTGQNAHTRTWVTARSSCTPDGARNHRSFSEPPIISVNSTLSPQTDCKFSWAAFLLPGRVQLRKVMRPARCEKVGGG